MPYNGCVWQVADLSTELSKKKTNYEQADSFKKTRNTAICYILCYRVLFIMEVQNGIWKVNTGKGDRIYIKCTDESKIMHPQELCKMNGIGMYGYEHLKDLAIAILRFEKQQQESESILGNF